MNTNFQGSDQQQKKCITVLQLEQREVEPAVGMKIFGFCNVKYCFHDMFLQHIKFVLGRFIDI